MKHKETTIITFFYSFFRFSQMRFFSNTDFLKYDLYFYSSPATYPPPFMQRHTVVSTRFCRNGLKLPLLLTEKTRISWFM